jgi:hypothetical protein
MAGKTPVRKELKSEKVQAMVTPTIAARLQEMAEAEGRSVSGMAAHILTQACGRRAK